MALTDITAVTRTTLDTDVTKFSVALKELESAESEEYYYYNANWSKWLGYYKQIPELKSAINGLAIWTIGKGYETDAATKVFLESLTGSGKDNDDSLLFNMFIIKKINGDAYFQIIRKDNKIINLKALNPSRVRIVYGKDGRIKRYEHMQNNEEWKKIALDDMFHLINDKIGDEVHGISVVEACQWVIDARNEAMSDTRRTLHRGTIRVIEVDMDDTSLSNLSNLKTQYAEAIKKGEVLFIPKGTSAIADFKAIDMTQYFEWIRYLENFFYQAVGIPKVIASSENFTEASSKIGYLAFEPVYTREQQILEAELWSQLQIKIKFNRPPSLSTMLEGEQEKNQAQTGFQPTEMMAGRNE